MRRNRRYNRLAEWRHGSVQFEVAQNVGWDQRRFAALAHHQFSKVFHGGPALEASWSHPTLKLGRTVGVAAIRPGDSPRINRQLRTLLRADVSGKIASRTLGQQW